MKAKLIFDLNDFDDMLDYTQCVNAKGMAHALFDIVYNLPKEIERKIPENAEDTVYDIVDAYRKRIAEILYDNHVNVEQLNR